MSDLSPRRSLPDRYLAVMGGVAGVLLVLLAAWRGGWPGAVVADDLRLTHLNQALPLLDGAVRVEQRFVPGHDGLSEVELQLVRYQTEEAGGDLWLRLTDDRARLVAERRLDATTLVHNQTVTLAFPPEPASAGRPYQLELDGSGPFSVWGSTLSMHDAGALVVSGAPTEARSLRLVARYTLTPLAALRTLGRMLWQHGALLLLALAFLPLPGCLLLLLAARGGRGWDPAAWAGVALALGLALWPLLWLWPSVLGARWSGAALWLLVGSGWALIIFQRARAVGRKRRGPSRSAAPGMGMLGGILLVSLATRLLAVRDLAFPPWVDAVRHGLITQIMASSGQAIASYEPWLPIDSFPYHAGFHTLAASLRLMSGVPLPELLLLLGQLLNALAPLSVYAAAWLMTRRQGVALIAAFLVALPFLFPGYYATWGRYTQLAGMLVMPPLVALTWRMLRGAMGGARVWGLVGLLAAGLFLIHLRVLLYYLPFPLLVWLAGRGRRGGRLFAAGALALLLVSWRAWQLFPRGETLGSLGTGIEGYNAFPMGYLTTGWERGFLLLVGASLLVALARWVAGRRHTALPLALGGWVGVLGLLLAGRYVGLPESWLVNLNSMYITLFFPFALLIALLLDGAWRWGARAAGRLPRPAAWHALRHALLGAGLAASLLFGIHHQVTILNPQTILAHPQDAVGLEWMAANLPANARVGVSAWRWLGTSWAGSDGGAWLLPLTGLASTTPPADYIYGPALAQEVTLFNEQASQVEDWSAPAAARWLREQGITHLFVGVRGGFLDPAELGRNPALRLLFARDGVFVFEVG